MTIPVTELQEQYKFYATVLPAVSPNLTVDQVLTDNTDGIVNGNILEFKLKINDINAVLLQAIKYLSQLRIKGKPVPKNILLVDLEDKIVYVYDSSDYLPEIETVYTGAASTNNKAFRGGGQVETLDYQTDKGKARLVDLLKSNNFTKIHLDENCIVGWANEFYRLKPTARKEDFIGDKTGLHDRLGEIRKPQVFEDYIHPYTEVSNVRFEYLMDRLNDVIVRKNLGAFYTPQEYAEKSHELLRKAIARVPEGNDYVIIDRCAGTGNLEKGLTDEELSHCILSTFEYYEYKVLSELLGHKVRHIIPPFETPDTFNNGFVRGADALSKEFVENELIREYLNNPKCTVILFENPPYAETSSIEHQKAKASKKSGAWKNTYVVQEMKKELKGTKTNDMANAFIWSAFKYYLRQPTDSYIVFSPIKYWKVHHMINNEFGGGYAFNRKHFNAVAACVTCILWHNIPSNIEEFELEAIDIVGKTRQLESQGVLSIKRIHTIASNKYYDRRPLPEDGKGKGVLCGRHGYEELRTTVKRYATPYLHPDILGYMCAYSSGFDNPDTMSSLLSCACYAGHGFFVRRDNFLEKLPLFAMTRYINHTTSWTERARVMKSGDGADEYHADVKAGKLDQWLLKVLLWTTLERQNHMLSMYDSKGNFYRNELCLDTTHGQTLATRELQKLKAGAKEQRLLNLWGDLLNAAKQAPEYNDKFTYGVYQIENEINTTRKDLRGNTVYNNVEVNSAAKSLKAVLKEYYLEEIAPVLFKYQFLK